MNLSNEEKIYFEKLEQESTLSVWNIVMSVYSRKYTDSMMPELNNMIAENTKK